MKWINRNDSEANFEDRRVKGRGLGKSVDRNKLLAVINVILCR